MCFGAGALCFGAGALVWMTADKSVEPTEAKVEAGAFHGATTARDAYTGDRREDATDHAIITTEIS